MRRRALTILLPVLFLFALAAAGDEAMLQICLAAHADYTPVYPTLSIPSSAKGVMAVFRFGNGETHKAITGTWVAVDVGAAATPNYTLSSKTIQGPLSKGRFYFTLPRPLPVGKYHLDVAADKKPWKSVEFSVVADAPEPTLAGPQALLPLRQGQTWTYDFVQQSGSGAHIELPGIKPDAEGRYHANVVMTAAAPDAAGQHVELRRNGQLVFEEWWRLDEKGLSATKRKGGDEVVVMDPPQILLPWPLTPARKWEYKPRDGSYHQTYSIWGPVPVPTSTGVKSGYVVFVEQTQGALTLSVERHFVPGVGMTREIIVTGLSQDMVSRQEMILRK
jgi:hypothetical protein